MVDAQSALANWTPDEISAGRRWVDTWRKAGVALDQIRRTELRNLDTRHAIALLLGIPIAKTEHRPSSGLIEQQRWFMRAAKRE